MGTIKLIFILIMNGVWGVIRPMEKLSAAEQHRFLWDPFYALATEDRFKDSKPSIIKDALAAAPLLNALTTRYIKTKITNDVPIVNTALSKNGDSVATHDALNKIKIWCSYSAQLLSSWQNNSGNITSLHFTPKGDSLLIVTHNGIIESWCISKKEKKESLVLNEPNLQLFLLDDNNFLTMHSKGQCFKAWSCAPMQEVKKINSPHSCAPDVVLMNDPGTILAVGYGAGDGYSMSCFDMRTCTWQTFSSGDVELEAAFTALQISSSENYRAAGTNSGELVVWHIKNNKNPIFTTRCGTSAILSICFHEDEKSCSVITRQGLVVFYTFDKSFVAEHNTLQKEFTSCLSQTSQLIAIADSKGLQFIWDLTTARMVAYKKDVQARVVLSNTAATGFAFVNQDSINIIHRPNKELAEIIQNLSIIQLILLTLVGRNPQFQVDKTILSFLFEQIHPLIKTIIQRCVMKKPSVIVEDQNLITGDGKNFFLTGMQAQMCELFKESTELKLAKVDEPLLLPSILESDVKDIEKVLSLLSLGLNTQLISFIKKKPLKELYRLYHIGRFLGITRLSNEVKSTYSKIYELLWQLKNEQNLEALRLGLPSASGELLPGDELIKFMSASAEERTFFDPLTLKDVRGLTLLEGSKLLLGTGFTAASRAQLIKYITHAHNLKLPSSGRILWRKYFMRSVLSSNNNLASIKEHLLKPSLLELQKIQTFLKEFTIPVNRALEYSIPECSTSMAYQHEADVLFVSASNGTTYCICLKNPRFYCIVLQDKKQSILAINNKGTLLALGNKGENALLTTYDLITEKIMKISAHNDSITTIDFRFDDQVCATGSIDNCVKLWRAEPLQLFLTLVKHAEEVVKVCFHSSEFLLATASVHELFIWNARNGDCLRSINVGTPIRQIYFMPTANKLLVGNNAGVFFLYDCAKKKKKIVSVCPDELITFTFYNKRNKTYLITISKTNFNTDIRYTALKKDLTTMHENSAKVGILTSSQAIHDCIMTPGYMIVQGKDMITLYSTGWLEKRSLFLKVIKNIIAQKTAEPPLLKKE